MVKSRVRSRGGGKWVTSMPKENASAPNGEGCKEKKKEGGKRR